MRPLSPCNKPQTRAVIHFIPRLIKRTFLGFWGSLKHLLNPRTFGRAVKIRRRVGGHLSETCGSKTPQPKETNNKTSSQISSFESNKTSNDSHVTVSNPHLSEGTKNRSGSEMPQLNDIPKGAKTDLPPQHVFGDLLFSFLLFCAKQ